MEDTKLLTWLIVAALAVNIIFGVVIYNKNVVAEVPDVEVPAPVITDQDKQDIAGLVLANIPAPVTPVPVVDESGESAVAPSDRDYIRNQREYEDDMTEAKASEIALEEFNGKDFKKQLFDVINAEIGELEFLGHNQYGLEIDSWRDIEDVDLESVSVEEVDDFDDCDDFDDFDELGEEFEEACEDPHDSLAVEFKFKVEYMLEDDDEEMHKARLTIVYIVEDLDFDDDFEDAQAIETFAVDAIKLYG